MDLFFAFGVIFIGGPIGALCLLIAGLGLWRGVDAAARARSKIFGVIGVVLLIASAFSAYAVSQINFGL